MAKIIKDQGICLRSNKHASVALIMINLLDNSKSPESLCLWHLHKNHWKCSRVWCVCLQSLPLRLVSQDSMDTRLKPTDNPSCIILWVFPLFQYNTHFYLFWTNMNCKQTLICCIIISDKLVCCDHFLWHVNFNW